MEPKFGKNSIRCNINVRQIMSIHYFEFKSDFCFGAETHPYWELVYVDRGTAIATVNDRTMRLSRGEIVFYKPGDRHAFASDPLDPPTVFIITFYCTSKDMQFYCDRRMLVPNPLRRYISEMISDGQEAYVLADDSPYEVALQRREDGSFGSEQLIKLNLEMLLLKLIRSATLPKLATDGDRHYDELTTTIIDILTNHVYGRITVAQIGKMLGFSRTYISAIFKANCGKTVMAYLNELKMSEAKYLIRKGQYSVSQVSDFLCYDNPQYFCRVFKKTVGLTPRQYSESVSYPDKYAKRP